MPQHLDRLLGDDAHRRALFPCLEQGLFLAHAGTSPLSGPARDAIQAGAARSALQAQEWDWVEGALTAARETLARLLTVEANSISLLGPTALGLNLVALGLDWEPGDEVVCYGGDYPTNVYPWRELARQGVVLRELRPELPGAISPALVEAALTPRTKLVALASCHYLSGYRLDVPAISAVLRQRGVLFCLDAIQSLGASPIDASQVDFLAADSHKWLLGPCGAGVFRCAPVCRERLRPALLGALNVHSPRFLAQDEIRPLTDGRRYEAGAWNILGTLGMTASLTLLLDLGIEAIHGQLLVLRETLRMALTRQGWLGILDPIEDRADADHWRSGILTLRHPTREAADDHARLLAQGVVTSLRHDADGQAWLRFSPHAYQREDEVLRVATILAD